VCYHGGGLISRFFIFQGILDDFSSTKHSQVLRVVLVVARLVLLSFYSDNLAASPGRLPLHQVRD